MRVKICGLCRAEDVRAAVMAGADAVGFVFVAGGPRVVDAAKLGQHDRLDGMKRLDRFVRALESTGRFEASFDDVVAHEHAISRSLGGRTVLDKPGRPCQLSLFAGPT